MPAREKRPTNNPYAPPAGDGRVPHGVKATSSSRSLSVAGGVALILAGLWSVVGGGCTIVAGQVASQTQKLAEDLAKDPLPGMDDEAAETLANMGAIAWKLAVCGAVILLAGVLCVVAAIFVFFDRAKLLSLLSCALGAVGELLFFALVAFNFLGLIKIALYGFGAFGALQVGGRAHHLTSQ